MLSKICTTCNEDKELSLFHKNKDHPSGYRSACKECVSNRYWKDLTLDQKAYKKEKQRLWLEALIKIFKGK